MFGRFCVSERCGARLSDLGGDLPLRRGVFKRARANDLPQIGRWKHIDGGGERSVSFSARYRVQHVFDGVAQPLFLWRPIIQ